MGRAAAVLLSDVVSLRNGRSIHDHGLMWPLSPFPRSCRQNGNPREPSFGCEALKMSGPGQMRIYLRPVCDPVCSNSSGQFVRPAASAIC